MGRCRRLPPPRVPRPPRRPSRPTISPPAGGDGGSVSCPQALDGADPLRRRRHAAAAPDLPALRRRRPVHLPVVAAEPARRTSRCWRSCSPVVTRRAARGGEDPPGATAALVRRRRGDRRAPGRRPLPFAIFGHSMGALVRVRAHGRPPSRPRLVGDAAPATTCRPAVRVRATAPRRAAQSARSTACPTMSSSTRCSGCYGGVPDVVRNEPELLALFLPALRADVRAFETYRAAHRPAGAVPGARLRRRRGHADPRRRSSPAGSASPAQPITVRTFAGDHFYLQRPPRRPRRPTSPARLERLPMDLSSPAPRTDRDRRHRLPAARRRRRPRPRCGGCSPTRSTRSARSPPTASTSTRPVRPGALPHRAGS